MCVCGCVTNSNMYCNLLVSLTDFHHRYDCLDCIVVFYMLYGQCIIIPLIAKIKQITPVRLNANNHEIIEKRMLIKKKSCFQFTMSTVCVYLFYVGCAKPKRTFVYDNAIFDRHIVL